MTPSSPAASTSNSRLRFIPFWELTYWGFVGITNLFTGHWRYGPISRNEDEFGNPCITLIVPLVGSLSFFYGRTVDRSRWFYMGQISPTIAMYVSPDYRWEAHLPVPDSVARYYRALDDGLPNRAVAGLFHAAAWRLSDEEVRVRATLIEQLDL